MEQRYIPLSFTAGAASLTASAPANANIAPPGFYMLFIIDANGVPSVARMVIVQGNSHPTVTLTQPSNGATFTAPATVNLAATASDADGTVTKVEFFNATTKLGEDTTAPYSFTWSGVAAGTYTLTARATDNVGGVTTSTSSRITVSSPNVAPSVSITYPGDAAIFTWKPSITITATASDLDGTITKVEFLNDTTVLGQDTSAPYSVTWKNVPQGSHSLTARATDNAGAVVTSDAVGILVRKR
jgi:hypothetical protein